MELVPTAPEMKIPHDTMVIPKMPNEKEKK
jgi:hypothetical protein